MSVEGMSSGYISTPNFMPSLPSDLSANTQQPENQVNGRGDKRVAGGYSNGPLNLAQDKNVVRNENFQM